MKECKCLREIEEPAIMMDMEELAHKDSQVKDKKKLQIPKEEMEDRLKEGCNIPRDRMKYEHKIIFMTGSKEDINKFPEDGEIGKAKAEDEVMKISFQFFFNKHEQVLKIDEKEIVLRDNNEMLREKSLKESKSCTEENVNEGTERENYVQDITTGMEETMRNVKQGDS
jgi:hypothetical protein